MKKLACLIPALFLLACNTDPGVEQKAVVADSAQKVNAPVQGPVPAKDALLKQIADLEKDLYASEQLDEAKAKRMVSLYESYYQNYHLYPETADFLFKAAEITENIDQPYRSIDFYTKCYEEYPAFKYRAECLFRMATLYDYKLNNYIKAKALYQEVKEQFPKSQMAKDADAALKIMTKSDAEVIKEFEKKNNVK